MITYKLHFIRHGMTEGNRQGLFVGRTDLPVSEEGFDQLALLRDTYDYPRVEAVYSSPLSRCRQTAEFLYPDHLLTVVEDLQEMDFGEFEGKSMEELSDREDFGRWLADSMHSAPPGGENGMQFAERLLHAVTQIFAHMMQEGLTNVAVVTHGGVIATLMSTLGLPRQPLQFWKTSGGRGFTCFVHPQIWQNDHLMEVAGILPHGAATACDNGTKKKG